jgi:hypothetical protein
LGFVLRLLWFAALLGAGAAVALGTVHTLRNAYEIRPAFQSLGLDYDIADNGDIFVEADEGPRPRRFPEGSYRIVGVDNFPVPADIRITELARRLATSRGPVVSLDIRGENGKLTKVLQLRQPQQLDPSSRRTLDIRVFTRIATGLLACGALLTCSFLLSRRRPNDPVALLLAFAFAGMAATIDPPLAMWMAKGWPVSYDIISACWFYLLLIGLAVFPDGIFVPKSYRWLLLAGVPLAIVINLPNAGVASAFVGLGALLAILVGQVIRYKRLGSGIERQQIKWAAFGFAAGLLLVLVAFVLLIMLPDGPRSQNTILRLTTVLMFSLGMASMPLGLLIALTRFRLWEADTVITRSAAYAVVTLIVGVVWAATSDLVKLVVEQVLGRESQAGATTVGAIIAAGIFSPTQSLVLGWTRKRFGGPVDRMRSAAERLKSWGLTETPSEVGTRALAIIEDIMHPTASAIVLDTALSRELVAARNTSSENDPALAEHLTLADEEGSVGTLLLGRRSDRNRYNRQQHEAVDELIPSIEEALRLARSRYSRESSMQQKLDEMAGRLAQLEGGVPKPA